MDGVQPSIERPPWSIIRHLTDFHLQCQLGQMVHNLARGPRGDRGNWRTPAPGGGYWPLWSAATSNRQLSSAARISYVGVLLDKVKTGGTYPSYSMLRRILALTS
jgi:hypothetical protein